MSPYEIIYAIREKLKEYVDDTRYTDTFLLYEIDLTRSYLLRSQYDRIQRAVDDQIVQTYIVDLEEVDISDSPLTNELSETIMRSTKPLPRSLELSHRNMIEKVTTGGKLDRQINIVTAKRFIYAGAGDYDGDQTFVMIDGSNYLYLKSNNNEDFTYETVSVSQILERPLEALGFNSIDSGADLNTFRYPISNTLALALIDEIVVKLAKLKSLPSDQENNSSDDATILNNGQQQKR